MNIPKNRISPFDIDSAEAVSHVREYTNSLRKSGHEPKAYVMTFGCQQNEADSEKLAGLCSLMGYKIIDTAEEADLVLVNTCAVREHAEQRALSHIGELKFIKEKNPDMIIGVGGCMASRQNRAEKLKVSFPHVDFSFSTAQIHLVPSFIAARLAGGRRFFPAANLPLHGDNTPDTYYADFPEDLPVVRGSTSRAWVSIMYGCNNFCTYCIVPYVRGRERSRRPADIEAEVRRLVERGYREITLLGQNVNSYGRGLDENVDFPALLERLAKIDGEFRIRFTTSHPKDVSPDLIRVMAENEKIARQFHLPIQSGSDRILHAMNRKYTAQSYFEKIDALRAAMPDITLTTDIIVGFPGETEADFEDTLTALRRVRYDMIFSFIYSPREGTPAAKMIDSLTREEKTERFARLLEVQNAITLEKNKAEIGRIERVLTDDAPGEDGVMHGRNEGNKIVRLTGSAEPGQFVWARITDAEPYLLHGEIVPPPR
ncbi:MAG TPA: tRNA (N6-isopentenyl adenosine(37)-C2)-methylthiotransferase MiaB [Bacillota bacterium]|nr:tRNA (N6-isopentenyl adenosine(37)-C2)-methylthiotransferase MiaB [Clostridiales bacterium]HOQ13727.1 tRNA (N6-isopentenyl adenosine(37)-C2)-methylthiotransferase MiaB [Bacillota bacterium]